jgi:hypothetical protein
VRWIRDFHKLKVWTRAHRLALDVYRATRPFPKEELYGLTRRPDFARFVDIAMGSASEFEYRMLLAADLELLPHSKFSILNAAVVEVKRMLAGLLRRLRPDV